MPDELTVDGYLADKSEEASELFRRFADLALACGDDVVVSVSRTTVYFKRKRTFAGGFVFGRHIEIVIDLLREVEHRLLRQAFPDTKKVTSHRFKISEVSELDEEVRGLICEAYETVGPGTR